MIAPTSAIRAPVRIAGSAAGITTLTSEAGSACRAPPPTRRSRGATCDVPAAVASTIGNTRLGEAERDLRGRPEPEHDHHRRVERDLRRREQERDERAQRAPHAGRTDPISVPSATPTTTASANAVSDAAKRAERLVRERAVVQRLSSARRHVRPASGITNSLPSVARQHPPQREQQRERVERASYLALEPRQRAPDRRRRRARRRRKPSVATIALIAKTVSVCPLSSAVNMYAPTPEPRISSSEASTVKSEIAIAIRSPETICGSAAGRIARHQSAAARPSAARRPQQPRRRRRARRGRTRSRSGSGSRRRRSRSATRRPRPTRARRAGSAPPSGPG